VPTNCGSSGALALANARRARRSSARNHQRSSIISPRASSGCLDTWRAANSMTLSKWSSFLAPSVRLRRAPAQPFRAFHGRSIFRRRQTRRRTHRLALRATSVTRIGRRRATAEPQAPAKRIAAGMSLIVIPLFDAVDRFQRSTTIGKGGLPPGAPRRKHQVDGPGSRLRSSWVTSFAQSASPPSRLAAQVLRSQGVPLVRVPGPVRFPSERRRR
jgi:hypothetical protein